MRHFQKFTSVFLILFLAVFPPVPISSLAYANANDLFQTSPTGSLIATIPFDAAQPAGEVSSSMPTIAPDSLQALADQSPLSAVEETSAEEDFSVSLETLESEEYDYRLSNDPFYPTSGSWGQSYADMWWHKRVRAQEAWEWALTRGAGITTAVIDTGVDFNHEDLSANIWYNNAELNGTAGEDDDGNGFVDDTRGWDFHNKDNNPQDDNGHGSHVAGIIAAVADNAKGIAGIAPDSKIMSLKVLSSSGSGFISDVIAAIRYAADKGAQVINMSLGASKALLSKSLRTSWESAVAYAVSKGSVVVAAAGNNNGLVSGTYPAAIRDVIAVGATEPVTDKRAYFSNFGSMLDFVAPGVDVLSLRAGGTSFGSSSGTTGYARASGTSMASPVVAGVVALLRSWNPLWNLSTIYRRLRLSAVDLGTAGFDKYYGYGLVDAYGALTVSDTSSSSTTSHNNGNSSSQNNVAVSAQSSTQSITIEQPLSQTIPSGIDAAKNAPHYDLWTRLEETLLQDNSDLNSRDRKASRALLYRKQDHETASQGLAFTALKNSLPLDPAMWLSPSAGAAQQVSSLLASDAAVDLQDIPLFGT